MANVLNSYFLPLRWQNLTTGSESVARLFTDDKAPITRIQLTGQLYPLTGLTGMQIENGIPQMAVPPLTLGK